MAGHFAFCPYIYFSSVYSCCVKTASVFSCDTCLMIRPIEKTLEKVLHSIFANVFASTISCLNQWSADTRRLLFLLCHCIFVVQHCQQIRVTLYLVPIPFITFTILTSTGSFTSTMTMHISKDQMEDVIFGRDWFNCCSTDIPFATQSRTMDLIEPGLCLCFGTLAQTCIQARVSLGQIS